MRVPKTKDRVLFASFQTSGTHRQSLFFHLTIFFLTTTFVRCNHGTGGKATATASAPSEPLQQFRHREDFPLPPPPHRLYDRDLPAPVLVTCEGSVAKLDCSHLPGLVLFVERALFGRLSGLYCLTRDDADKTIPSNVLCGLKAFETEGVVRIVRDKCEGRTLCEVFASTTVFNDSCPDIPKYLEINYKCAPPLPRSPSTPSEIPTTLALTPSTASTTSSTSSPSSTSTPLLKYCVDAENEDALPIPVGAEVRKKCEEGEGFKVSFCAEDGILKPVATKTFCLSLGIKEFEDKLDDEGETSDGLVTELVNITTSDDSLTPGDIRKTTQFFQILQKRIKGESKESSSSQDETHRVIDKMITLGDKLIDQKSWKKVPLDVRIDAASDLMTSMEATAFVLADFLSTNSKNATNKRTSVTKNNVHLEVAVSTDEKEEHLHLPEVNSEEMDSIVIPMKNFRKSAEEKGKEVKVVFLSYAKIGSYLSDSNAPLSLGAAAPSMTDNDTVNANWTVNTNVVTASVNSKSTWTPLEYPISIAFQNKEKISWKEGVSEHLIKCVFWDNYNNSHGSWSPDGCDVEKINSTHTVCSCYHLTSFSVLMDFNAVFIDHTHELYLMAITYVGCISSIVALLLAFATFTLFKNLQCERNTLHKNLCVCLLAAEMVFVTGIDKTHNQLLCTSIAVLLHFFFLAAFAWMCLEGIQLYLMLIKVFEPKQSRTKWYYSFGYGLPLIVVSITVTLSEILHETTRYGTGKYCWLSYENGFIFAFIGPVVLVLTLNVCFLAMAFYQMCTHTKSSRSGNHEYSVWTWIKGATVLVVLLGLTWSTGLLLINKESLFMAYIFTILNSLQGVFIFVFHCCTNEKVRKEYSKVYQRRIASYLTSTKSGEDSSRPRASTSGPSHLLKWWENGILKRSKNKDVLEIDSLSSKRMENGFRSGGDGEKSAENEKFMAEGFLDEKSKDGEFEDHELHALSMIDDSVVASECVTDFFDKDMGRPNGEEEEEEVSPESDYQVIQEYKKPEPIYVVLEQPYPTGIYEVDEDYLEPISSPEVDPSTASEMDQSRTKSSGEMDQSSAENDSGVITGPVSFRVKQNGKSPSKMKPKSKAYSPHGAFLKDIPSRLFAQKNIPPIQLRKFVRRSHSPPVSPTSDMTTSLSSSTMSTSLHSSVIEEHLVEQSVESITITNDFESNTITTDPLPDVTRTYQDQYHVQYSEKNQFFAQITSSHEEDDANQRDFASLHGDDGDGGTTALTTLPIT